MAQQDRYAMQGYFVLMRFFPIALVVFVISAFGARAVEVDVDRPGLDYRNFEIEQTNPGPCIEACEADSRCRAWTYVKPGIQGARAQCWLKSAVPEAYTSVCCISGITGDDPQTAEVREVQSLLASLGYDPGPIDGKPGRRTTAAIRRFQSKYGLTENGRISPALIKGLWGVTSARDLEAPAPVGDADRTAPPVTTPSLPPDSVVPTTPVDDLSDLNSLD